jgi:tripartite motif-containing protein 37
VISRLKEQTNVPVPSPIAVSAGFDLSVKPEYVASTLILHDFTALQSHTEVTYSEPLHCYNSTWRLKLYPSGNGSAQHTHLSLFLEQLQGSVQGNYDYRVKLVNPMDPDLRLVREFSSDFTPGECWGYNRFLQLDKLLADGYLDPSEDRLVFRFAVRPSSYRQLCSSQRAYIETLERTLASRKRGNDQGIEAKPLSESPLPLLESIDVEVMRDSEEENDGLSMRTSQSS